MYIDIFGNENHYLLSIFLIALFSKVVFRRVSDVAPILYVIIACQVDVAYYLLVHGLYLSFLLIEVVLRVSQPER